MLEREGFHYSGYLDIFDGGPTVEAKRKHISTVKHSRNAKIAAISDEPIAGTKFIMLTTELISLRIIHGNASIDDNGEITISANDAKKINVSTGDSLRIVEA